MKVVKIGYTHYWRTSKEMDSSAFQKVVQDFRRMLPVLDRLGIKLAGWKGKGKPAINDSEISFNGEENCGHQERDLGIAWPSHDARGVSLVVEKEKFESDVDAKLKPITKNGTITVLSGNPLEWSLEDSDVSGTWFAGAQINTRTCGGDCSHESFILRRRFTPESWQEPEDGKYFHFCKTAYKPYDFAVNAALIIAQHHFGKQVVISSDGSIEHWRDAMELCQMVLGYGLDFRMD